MSDKEKLYNLILVGPDTVEGHSPTEKPDFSLPEPGPDNEYYYNQLAAPGYKLGSYLNVYNFDAIINEILGCDDWSTFLHPKKVEYFNGSCMVYDIVGSENYLSIEAPEQNNIPKNVCVLIEQGMLKGEEEPNKPDAPNNFHHHYSNLETLEEKRIGWWISEELKEVLTQNYGWKFFEDVNLEEDISDIGVVSQYVLGEWSGGVAKGLMDTQYHDLRIALNDHLNIANIEEDLDTRATGERLDVLCLFGYVADDETTGYFSPTATLTGDCEEGFHVSLEWEHINLSNPDVSVESYQVFVRTSPDVSYDDATLLAEIPVEEGALSYQISTPTEGMPTGIPYYPLYIVKWVSSSGEEFEWVEATNLPSHFQEYGLPSCVGESIELQKDYIGECWTSEYGKLELSWNISLPENTEIKSLKLVKSNDESTIEYELETDVRSFVDESAVYIENSLNLYNYKVYAEISPIGGEEVTLVAESNNISHETPECNCEDIVDDICADKCWIRGQNPGACDDTDSETSGFKPELLIWMENYSEDPFSENPSSSFEIKYCISDKCSSGISDFSLRLKLPEQFSIINADSSFGGLSVIPDFSLGQTINEWVIEPDYDWTIADPSHGTLAKITMDKPLGTSRVEFIPEDDKCIITVASEIVDDSTYRWFNNALNPEGTQYIEWQSGPPLSSCTDEIDMGYGDYLIDLASIDPRTIDVNFCLSRDDFDTFILVVLNTDFSTTIDSIDPIIGRAAQFGWNVTFRNIAPGMSVILGNGDSDIPSSGYDTLLRMILSEDNTLEGSDGCTCVFPFFLKLGDLWETVKNISETYSTNKSNSSLAASASYTTASTTQFAGASPIYNTSSNPVLSGLSKISDNIDPRFKEIVCCLHDAYKAFLIKSGTPGTLTKSSDVIQVTFMVQIFLTMISMFSTISIAKSKQINKQLDKIADLGETVCNNYLKLEAFEGTSPDEIDIVIKHSIPVGSVCGVQFQINIPEGYAINRNGLLGDAKDRGFLQILGNNGAYMCVYDYELSSSASVGASYLSTSIDSESTLTSFKLIYVGEESPLSLEQIKPLLGIFGDSPTYLDAKMVTNDTRTNPTQKWNGDWYNVDQRQEVDVRDFLVACILTTGGEGDLAVPDSVMVLPNNETVSTKYFGGNAYDLSNLTYDTETYFGRDDEGFQEYMLDFFDANGDGVTDVTDVVTIRNLFLVFGSSLISRKVSTNVPDIVPSEVCTVQRAIDFEFYIPDECSNFCVKTRCFSKIWISDVVESSKGHLIEVSYAVNCDDAGLSGAQFTIDGLYLDGIVACINPDGQTVLSSSDWKFDIISSNRFTETRDTVIAYSKNERGYVTAGTGVLTYLLVNKSSIYGFNTKNDAYKTFMHTNTPAIVSTVSNTGNIESNNSGGFTSLMATHQTSSEILSYQNLGLRISSQILTSNDSLEQIDPEFDISIDPDILTKLISYNSASPENDSNKDSLLNVADVQALYHLNNMSSFPSMSGDVVVPTSCCPCDSPGELKLALGDFLSRDSEGNPALELSKDSGWLKYRRYDVSQFSCDRKHQGGVIIAWTPSETAKYYIVYRRRKGQEDTALPIIGSKVGVVANNSQFSYLSQKLNRSPMQIDSTVWVDFPPQDYKVCCDWCPDSEDDNCHEETNVSIEYEYYVVAYNECGQSSSNILSASLPCCNYSPYVYDEFINVQGNVSLDTTTRFTGRFKIATKNAEDVYVYTDKLSKTDKTEAGGVFTVSSGAPYSSSTGEYGVANSLTYTYTPPVGFFGIDRIKFSASVRNRRVSNWNDWCSEDGVVNIIVYPPQVPLRLVPGDCLDGDTRHTVTLFWDSMVGVEYYKIYRFDELIDTVRADEAGALISYQDIKVSELVEEECSYHEDMEWQYILLDYAVVPVVTYEGEEIYPKPQYHSVEVTCCEEIENPDFSVVVEKEICDENNRQQTGMVKIFWKDLGDFDEYGVFRRKSDDEEWVLIEKVTSNPDAGGTYRVYDKVLGCTGCKTFEHQYSVVTYAVSGQGKVGENKKVIRFECCNSKPKAYDSNYIIENNQKLIDKQLVASDRDADIVSFEIVEDSTGDAGFIYEFDQDRGTFSFAPRPLFEGSAMFTWKVTDSCGNHDTASVYIEMTNAEICNEDDYIICNATIPFLTEQQDQPHARIKIEELPQVPFFLNNKGVPSIRRRCGAYSVTSSVDPSLFALPEEGCLFIEFDGGISFRIPTVSVECIDEIYFNSCKDTTIDGIPSVIVNCIGELSFSKCTPVNIDSLTVVSATCDREEAFSDCKDNSSSINPTVECSGETSFMNCDPENK